MSFFSNRFFTSCFICFNIDRNRYISRLYYIRVGRIDYFKKQEKIVELKTFEMRQNKKIKLKVKKRRAPKST